MVGELDRLDERATLVLALSQEEALRLAHNYIGEEHLLLGLLREADGVAARALGGLGIALSRTRAAVEYVVGRGEGVRAGGITLSPRAKTIIVLANDEADDLGDAYVGTEHLLLALTREGKGLGAGIIESCGISLRTVRTHVIAALARPSGTEDAHK